jgi:hypothetical protein
MRWPSTALVTMAGAALLVAASPLVKRGLNTPALAHKYFGNDAPWYQDRVPYFECSDSEIQDVYYYRWKIFRAHQRDLGERGYISTGMATFTSQFCHAKLTTCRVSRRRQLATGALGIVERRYRVSHW